MFPVNLLIIIMFLGLEFLSKDAVCSITWSHFHSGSPSTEGRLKSMSIPSLSHCAVECFVHTQCEIFGHDSTDNRCFLHDGSFTSTTQQSSAATLRYYKASLTLDKNASGATCGGTSTYIYIKSLQKCLMYVSDKMKWEDAKSFCEESGGHLVYVKPQATLDYLNDQRESARSKYWLGGTQVEEGSNAYKWLSGDILNTTNGGQLWLEGRPKRHGGTVRICIETLYSSRLNSFGLRDRRCDRKRNFFCERDQL